MTNAEALRALATVMEQDETLPYKAFRLADPEGLAIKMLRDAANELLGWDESLMELMQLYRSRWLSCVTQEEAQRLREEIERVGFKRDLYHEWWKAICEVELEGRREIARLKREIGAHTPGVMSEGEGITDEDRIERMACALQETPTDWVNPTPWRFLSEDIRRQWRKKARAAIAAYFTHAELAQRKLNDDAWGRKRDFRLGTDRGQG